MENNKEIPKETPKEKAKRLGWLGAGDDKEIGPKGSSLGLSNILLSAVISLIVAGLIVSLVVPTKGNLQTLRDDLEARFVTLSSGIDSRFTSYQTTVGAQISALESRFGTLESSLGGRVGASEAKIAGLAGLDGRVTSALAGIDGKVNTAVDAKIKDLEARLKKLEDSQTTTTGGGTTVGDVTIAVTHEPSDPVYSAGEHLYILQVTNSSSTFKKVYIQAVYTLDPTFNTSGSWTVTSASTTASDAHFHNNDGAFTTTLSPTNGAKCFMISAGSNEYILLGNATVQISLTFNLAYTGDVVAWIVTFTPIAMDL